VIYYVVSRIITKSIMKPSAIMEEWDQEWDHTYNQYDMSERLDEFDFIDFEDDNRAAKLKLDKSFWDDCNGFSALVSMSGRFTKVLDLETPLFADEILDEIFDKSEFKDDEPSPNIGNSMWKHEFVHFKPLSTSFVIDNSIWGREHNDDKPSSNNLQFVINMFAFDHDTNASLEIPESIQKLLFGDDDDDPPLENIYIKRFAEKNVYKIGRTTLPSKLRKGTRIFQCVNSKRMKSKIARLFKSKYKHAKTYGSDYFEGDYKSMLDSIISVLADEM